MENTTKYWAATTFRGIAGILAGVGMIFFPHAAWIGSRYPFALSLSILCLASFGVIDGAILLKTNWAAPVCVTGRLIVRTQGIIGATTGILLFWLLYLQADVRWFLDLGALQACLAACTSLAMSVGLVSHRKTLVCYCSALVSTLCAFCLLAGSLLPLSAGSWLIDGYLCLFGLNLMILAVGMLSGEVTPQLASI